jgi:hypothetical protein
MKMSLSLVMIIGLSLSVATSTVVAGSWVTRAKQSISTAMSSASNTVASAAQKSAVAAQASLAAAGTLALARTQCFSKDLMSGALHASSIAVGARIAQLYKIDRNKLLFATAYAAVLRAGIQYCRGTSYLGIIGDACVHTAEIGFGFASRYFYDMMMGEKKPAASQTSAHAPAGQQQQQNQAQQPIHLTISANNNGRQ